MSSLGGGVSLKDRLRQFQELKTAAQAKSNPALEQRQQELEFLAERSPMQESKRQLEVGDTSKTNLSGPGVTVGGDDPTVDTADETKASTVKDEMSPGDESTAAEAIDKSAPKIADETPIPPKRADEVEHVEEELVEEEVMEEVDEEESVVEEGVVEEYVEESEDEEEEGGVEVVVESESEAEDKEVESESEAEDKEVESESEDEEVVVGAEEGEDEEIVFEHDQGEDSEYEELEESERQTTDRRFETGVKVEDGVANEYIDESVHSLMDEKTVDEFAGEFRPIVDKIEAPTAQDEEAPEDELAFISRRKLQDEKQGGTSGKMGVFAALDGDESSNDGSSSGEEDSSDEDIGSRDIETGVVARSRAPQEQAQSTPQDNTKSMSPLPGRPSKPDDSRLSRDAPEEGKARFNCILCCLLLIGAAAIVAIVLPFVLDYGDTNEAPVVQGAPPTFAPGVQVVPTTPTQPFTPTAPAAVPTMPTQPSTPTAPAVVPPTPSQPSTPTAPAGVPTTPSRPSTPTAPAVVPTTPSQPTTPTQIPTLFVPATPVAPSVPSTSPNQSSPSQGSTLAPTTLRLGRFIETFVIPASGQEVLQDRNSAQYRAAEYIANVDPYTNELTDLEKLADRYAATTFYYATGGDSWSKCNLGDATCSSSWLTGDVCGWYGVTCDDGGRIMSIVFDENEQIGLSGYIPPEIGLIEDLQVFSIINEPIGGTLPPLTGQNSTSLKQVIIQGTQISGQIPDGFLSQSPTLQLLKLASNLLTGTIPNNLANSATLLRLDLGENAIGGTIPSQLSTYDNLERLTLKSNKFTGGIPESIYSMSNLLLLDLNQNPLITGNLSSSIGSLASIQEFRVGSTNIAGAIPDEFFTLTNLQELDLSGANFRGQVSSNFAMLSNSLSRLYLQDNDLSGTVPVSFGQLSYLNVLQLQGNNFVGSIAPEICSLRGSDPLQDLTVLTVDCNEVSCNCCTQCYR